MPQIAVGPQISQVWAGGGPVVLVNQDPANAVTIGRNQGALSIGAANADPIVPGGSITYQGHSALYAIAPAGTAPLLVIPAATSAAASAAGSAAQTTELGNIAANTGNALTFGVPPAVQGITSASLLQQVVAGSPHTIFTFPAAGRIWDISLSAALVAGGAYASGRQNVYVLAKAGSVVLEVLEMAVSNANQVDSDHGDLSLNGLAAPLGTVLTLDVNNGVSIDPDAELRASVNVLYSVP